MNIWIFQTGEPIHSDGRNVRPMRAMNLANKLLEAGHSVTIWSSAFFHQTKTHRSKIFKEIKISKKLTIKLIPSTGYKKHISISRFFDHCILAYNFHKILRKQTKIPDVSFVGYPPIEAAYVISLWLKKKNVPFLIDVKDQWPKIIVERFPRPLRYFIRFILTPYYFMAKRAMQFSSGISAHVPAYIDWSLKFSKKLPSKNDKSFPLTVPQDKIDSRIISSAIRWWSKAGIKKSNTLRIIYIGSFASVFNFEPIFEASKYLSKKNFDYEFIICGSGDRKAELSLKAKLDKNIKIIDWIDRPKIVALASISDLALAPYYNTEDFVVSIPNKVIDSLMLGLPVLSSLKGEVESLIRNNNIGYSYTDGSSLSKCIEQFAADKSDNNKLSTNAKALYKSKFDFNSVYNELVLHLEKLKTF